MGNSNAVLIVLFPGMRWNLNIFQSSYIASIIDYNDVFSIKDDNVVDVCELSHQNSAEKFTYLAIEAT
jgi:hypothetical protein